MSTLNHDSHATPAETGPVPCTGTNVPAAIDLRDSGVWQAKILIVDDEPLSCKSVEEHLSAAGYENLTCITDAREALNLIYEDQPDLLLLDIAMPNQSGLELLQQVRGISRLLPVIVLTASSNPDAKHDALLAGATDFLAKPVDSGELSVRVRNTLIVKLHQDNVSKRAQQLELEVGQQAEALAEARDHAKLRYTAGKAEIASDVLHNVGNALHSVNVGVNLVAMTVQESKLQSLKRATDLLQQHESGLARFLTQDERGRVLPSYLVDIANALLEERETISRELELLAKHLDHINAVVATQQKYAALCNVTENVSLIELLEDTEELLRCSVSRQGIEVVRDYEDIPPVKTDRQKLLQVLVNVFKNAVQAIQQIHTHGAGRIEIRCGRIDAKRAFIAIRDNGVGIAHENMVKIFSHGFTTKPDGHGFGLHSCANIMKELGGSIRAESDGEGANFQLELPF